MIRRKKKKKIGFLSKIMLASNIAAAVVLLLSYLASVTDPKSFWPIAFVGLAYPFILGVNVLFAIYYLIRKPLFALIPVAAILLGWKFLTSYIGFRETTAIEVPKSSGNFLRVMTYNVHSFKQFGNKNDAFTKDQILNIIRKEQPDVICFQEFFSRRKGEYNFRRLVKEVLDTEHYYFVPAMDNDYEAMGLAIFTKLPVRDKGHIRFDNSRGGNEAIFLDVEFKKKPVRIYNVHFQSISFQPEDYSYLKDATQNIEPDVASSKRIGRRLKQAFVKRSDQVKVLKEHTETCKTPFVVAGDFNDTPISYTVNYMMEDLTNCFRKKGSGFGITYNGDFPNFQIDYILASDHFDVKNYRIVKKKLSDHYAVRSDIELKSTNDPPAGKE
ncbi:MAG TPA: endonuclease/exonuclease/phosphatase family protein [Sphingobacteriaceae bacterium]